MPGLRKTFDCACWARIAVSLPLSGTCSTHCQAYVPCLVRRGMSTFLPVAASVTNFIGHVGKALIILAAASLLARRVNGPDGAVWVQKSAFLYLFGAFVLDGLVDQGRGLGCEWIFSAVRDTLSIEALGLGGVL